MRVVMFTLALCLSFGILQAPCTAARPGAPHLMPHDVLAYARIDDASEMREIFKDSSFGRMLNDPKLKPLASDLYGAGAELFEKLSEQLGVSLDELLSIPDGEVAFALLPFGVSSDSQEKASPKAETKTPDDSPEAIRERINQRRRRNAMVGALGILETGDQEPLLKTMLDRLADQLANQNYVNNDREVLGVQITGFRAPSVSQPGIEFCQVDGVTLFGVGEGVVEDALQRWKGKAEGKTLAQNEDFAAVMGPCVGAEDTEPQITFFVNPFGIAERFIKNAGGGAALVWPIVADLGASKIKGIGGSSFTGNDFFEGILHVHVLIESPRDGFFAVLRPKSGDINPPNWIPDDVSSYTAVYWDFPNAYKGLGRILDRFQGEDTLARKVETPFLERTKIDLQKELIDQMTGRVTMARWYEPPAKVNSQTRLVAIEMKDPARTAETLNKLAKAFPNQLEKQYEGSVVVYRRPARADAIAPEGMRPPQPQLALLGNHVVFCDSTAFLQRAIRADAGAVPRLTGVVEYDLIASEVGGKLDGQPAFLFSFSRAQETLRQFYEMAAAPGAKEDLARAGETNETAAKLSEIMKNHELPPFDALSKYFAPTGAFAYDSPTGIHYTTFTLRGDK